MSTRPAWTLTEAAEKTGASRSTLRRYREAGRFPGAYKDSSGAWRFPLPDLLAAGLRVIDPAQSGLVSTPSEQGQPSRLAELEREVSELQGRLAVERERSAGLERVARAAEANAADLRMALRMLEGGRAERPTERAHEQALSMPTGQPVSSPVSAPERPPLAGAEPATERPSRGLLGRLRERLQSLG